MRASSRSSVIARALALGLVAAVSASVLWSPRPGSVDAASIGPNGQGTLLFVGDSLTVGSVAFGKLTKRIEATGIWTSVVMDAKVGRKASQGADVLKARVGRRTTAIVIALGINDMISRTERWYPAWVIAKVMKQSGGRPVLWVNPKFSPTGRRDWISRAARFNRALRSAQDKWPNLEIGDWSAAFVPSGRSRFIEDGVHLTVSGYKTRATFCARAVANFGRQLVDSTTTTTTVASEPSTTVPESTTTTTTTTPG